MKKLILNHSKSLTIVLDIFAGIFIVYYFLKNEAWNDIVNIFLYVFFGFMLLLCISLGIYMIKEHIETENILKK